MSDVESILETILLYDIGISPEIIEKYKNKEKFLSEIGLDDLDKIELEMKIENSFWMVRIEYLQELYNYSFLQLVKAIENLCNGIHPGFHTTVKNQPFCKLMERPCYMPKQENNTDKPYCDFIKCKLYENFNKLR